MKPERYTEEVPVQVTQLLLGAGHSYTTASYYDPCTCTCQEICVPAHVVRPQGEVRHGHAVRRAVPHGPGTRSSARSRWPAGGDVLRPAAGTCRYTVPPSRAADSRRPRLPPARGWTSSAQNPPIVTPERRHDHPADSSCRSPKAPARGPAADPPGHRPGERQHDLPPAARRRSAARSCRATSSPRGRGRSWCSSARRPRPPGVRHGRRGSATSTCGCRPATGTSTSATARAGRCTTRRSPSATYDAREFKVVSR